MTIQINIDGLVKSSKRTFCEVINKSSIGLIAILIAFISILLSAPASQGGQDEFPFRPGEKFTFQIKWAFLKAGTAVLQVYPQEMVNGKKAHHFVMTTRTTTFVDLFYKVRDRIDAYTDEAMTRSVLYKKQKDGL